MNGRHFCSLLTVMTLSLCIIACHGSSCASLLYAAVQAAMCGGARLPGAPPWVQEMAAALCVCWPRAWQLTLTKHPNTLLDIYSAALFNKNPCCRRRRLVFVSLPQRSASAGSPPLPSLLSVSSCVLPQRSASAGFPSSPLSSLSSFCVFRVVPVVVKRPPCVLCSSDPQLATPL